MMPFLRKFDLRDLLLVVGLVALIGGISHFSEAVASIVFGILCLITSLRTGKRPERKS